MYLLHNIGEKKNSNYNTREEIVNSQGWLTFDGVYKNVYENRDILIGRDKILFVTGDYVGKDNSFDAPMPLERFCDWNEIMELVIKYYCVLGWHSWSHRDLTTLSSEELWREVKPPFPMDNFAYPYGKFDDRVIQAVKDAGYKFAYSVIDGDDSDYQILRKYL